MTLVIAHRGARREAAENTIAAFVRARELGADGVELDVRRTRDGHLVVGHDPDGPAGAWVDLTRHEIRSRLPAVPDLDEALAACAGLLVNIEIKNAPGEPDWDPRARVADLVVECLSARADDDRVLVSSFDLATVDRVRMIGPAVDTAVLTSTDDVFHALATVDSHGHRALHPHVSLLAGPTAGALVPRAHELGIDVNVWTVNDQTEIARLARAGVDGICTDVPGLARAVLREI